MSVLTNKHVVVALIVAPILAILAYFGVDALVSEKPHPAQAGSNYELLEKPNCRYSSGACGLKNGDFELKLSVEWKDGGAADLMLRSIFPLDGARVAVVTDSVDAGDPVAMTPADNKGLSWVIQLPKLLPEQSRIRVAVSSGDVVYYGDVSARFSVYETSFGNDFRKPGE